MPCSLVALIAAVTALPAAADRTPDTVAVERVVDRFNAARAAFAPDALAATLAPDFEEISPVGDVDDRAKVLGFYRADQRRPVPPTTTSDRQVAVRGTLAIETERLSFAIARPDGATITRSIRVRYVAVRTGADWRLLSVQYTPIPPAK